MEPSLVFGFAFQSDRIRVLSCGTVCFKVQGASKSQGSCGFESYRAVLFCLNVVLFVLFV